MKLLLIWKAVCYVYSGWKDVTCVSQAIEICKRKELSTFDIA
jgi:hypothetical protein